MSSYILKIIGKKADRFLVLLLRRNVNFLLLNQTPQSITIEVDEESYEIIKTIKTSYDIKIIKRKGLAYFLYLFKTKKIFLSAILLSFITLSLLTRMTFSIQVIDTDKNIREMIMQDLNTLGIKKYHFKVSYPEKEKIRDQILALEKEDLEWIEIEEIGTTYQIKVIKRVKKKTEENKEERHIVAAKEGMILEVTAEQGEIVVKKNDYVKKGDVLISGLIKNKEEIVAKTTAIGKVYAEVWYEVKLDLPLHYEEETKTGKQKEVLEITFLNQNFALNEITPYQHAKRNEKRLWKHSLLPLQITLTKKEELKVKQVEYNNSTMETEIIPLAIAKLKQKLGPDIEIISQKKLKKEVAAGRMKIEIFFKVKEDITAYQSIKDIDIAKENEENKEE